MASSPRAGGPRTVPGPHVHESGDAMPYRAGLVAALEQDGKQCPQRECIRPNRNRYLHQADLFRRVLLPLVLLSGDNNRARKRRSHDHGAEDCVRSGPQGGRYHARYEARRVVSDGGHPKRVVVLFPDDRFDVHRGGEMIQPHEGGHRQDACTGPGDDVQDGGDNKT